MNKIISNRGTEVPFKIIEAKKGGPLVIMVHGFKANMHEDNRFIQIGNELSKNGINSIMFLQICGEDSKEDFINFNLDNSIDDLDKCLKYMIDNYQIDINNISLIGYSLGARIISLVMNKYNIKNVIMIAPAIFKGLNNNSKFLGNDIEKLKREANEKGYANLYYEYENINLKLSKRFIDNMEEYDPYIELNKYEGNILIIHGKKDDIVDYKNSYLIYDNLINVKDKKLILFDHSDHSFGGWSNNLNIEESNNLCNEIIKYLLDKI